MAQAALNLGHTVVIVSGPVEINYPQDVDVIPVISTQDMFDACVDLFPSCDGAIGVAAPCDYRPLVVSPTKLAKTGAPLQLDLFETRDIIAHLGASKREDQWVVGFALETHDERFRALAKLEEKACDLIILNRPEAMDSATNQVELLDPSGQCVSRVEGSKEDVARELLQQIEIRLVQRTKT
jgi:phosphopantothenoylcysteine decarboxylase/phosphopantothenate--cysteine ligase